MPRPTVELSMIVKDGGASLDRCLASVAGLVDRIVIGDTGSTDDTPAIATRHNAELHHIPWAEDFAQARNQVLAHAQCDWILVLDADEMLDPAQARNLLPTLLASPTAHAFELPRWNYLHRADRTPGRTHRNPRRLPEAAAHPAYVLSSHIRLFRRHPQVYFEHCVHERITHRLEALELSLERAPLVLHHFGYVEITPAARQCKIDLYRKLSLQKLATMPENFETYYQLGISDLYHKNLPEEALRHFRAAGALRPQDGRALLYSGVCLNRLGRTAEARQALIAAEALNERDPILFDTLGDVYLQTGEYASSLEAYQRLRRMGKMTASAEAREGAAEVYLGDRDKGLARIQRAIARAENPAPLQLLYKLVEKLPDPNEDPNKKPLSTFELTKALWSDNK